MKHLLVLFALCPLLSPFATERPNILLILPDQMRASAIDDLAQVGQAVAVTICPSTDWRTRRT
jgi:hypothetical protein